MREYLVLVYNGTACVVVAIFILYHYTQSAKKPYTHYHDTHTLKCRFLHLLREYLCLDTTILHLFVNPQRKTFSRRPPPSRRSRRSRSRRSRRSRLPGRCVLAAGTHPNASCPCGRSLPLAQVLTNFIRYLGPRADIWAAFDR